MAYPQVQHMIVDRANADAKVFAEANEHRFPPGGRIKAFFEYDQEQIGVVREYLPFVTGRPDATSDARARLQHPVVRANK